jgi:hypothetical protein
LLGSSTSRYQPSVFEYVNMLGDGLKTNCERSGQFAHGGLARSQSPNDCASRGIGESRQDPAQSLIIVNVCCLFNH